MEKRTLGKIERKHLPLIKSWRNSQREILRQNKILTDIDQNKWFNFIQKDARQKLFSLFENGNLFGYCGLTNIDRENKRAEISFLVNPDRVKNSRTYKEDFLFALSALCNEGFRKLKLNKIFTETFEYRKNHMKILESFGFKKEAVMQKHYYKKGIFYNSIIHSKFK